MTSPRTALSTTLLALLLGAVFDVESLTARLALEPETPTQQAVLGALQRVEVVARAVGLTAPRRWLRSAAGRSDASLEQPERTSPEASERPVLSAVVPVRAEEGLSAAAVEVQPADPPAPLEPIDVWVIGDSLINMGGPRLATLLEETIQARVRVDSRPNTGLVRPDYYDWPGAVAQRLQAEGTPELVVVLMGANDGQNMRVDGKRTERWSDPWRAEYRVRVSRMMDLLTESGAKVAWLGLPGMKSRTHQRTADVLNAVLLTEAAKNPNVRFIPSESWFSYQNRRYSMHLEHDDGRRFTARAGDGVHFTWSGSRVLADRVLSTLQFTWPELMRAPDLPTPDATVAGTVNLDHSIQ